MNVSCKGDATFLSRETKGVTKGDATFLSRENEGVTKGGATFLSREKNIVYLYGAPASGKTTLGRRLAVALGCAFVDLDEAIVRRAEMPIPKIFELDGEDLFRTVESAELMIVGMDFVQKRESAVIALGGGTLLAEANRAFCEKTGTVICLETPSEEELARRIGDAAGSRPLGNRAKERAAHYASFPNRLAAWFVLGNSLVVVGQGLADVAFSIRTGRVPTARDATGSGRESTARTNFVVADATVARLYRDLRPLATIPSGEEHKTISTVATLWSAFVRAGLGRGDTVVAVGGGVTGDLTGFAAATFMRGIDWINVPTTLLSMTDASTGGKTGCDLPEGKNLAGAFHAPKLVVIDADFLKTLPLDILRAGKAEMIKHALIGGRAAYPFGKCVATAPTSSLQCVATAPSSSLQCVATTPTPSLQCVATAPTPSQVLSSRADVPSPAEIAANLAVKVEIVRKDPFEKKGERLKLNCGHTIGHAVEKLSNYTVSHGDAVAIGCVEEARLAAKKGLCAADWPDEVAAAFAAEGLPTELPPGMDWAKMAPVMRGDKKRAGSVVTFALPCGWGDVRAVPIDFEKDAP